MKTIATIAIAIFAIGINAADLTTKDGKVYKDYEIISVTDKSVKIAHEDGAADVDIPDLPDDVKSSIADKAKTCKPPVNKTIVSSDKIIQGPTLTTPAPAKVEAVTDKKLTPEQIELQDKIKNQSEKITEYKTELKETEKDLKLKGTFKSESNKSLVRKLESKKEALEKKIRNAEEWKKKYEPGLNTP